MAGDNTECYVGSGKHETIIFTPLIYVHVSSLSVVVCILKTYHEAYQFLYLKSLSWKLLGFFSIYLLWDVPLFNLESEKLPMITHSIFSVAVDTVCFVILVTVLPFLCILGGKTNP